MKHHGTRIIIGDFFETAARQVMCDAHSEGMTQANGYVWFLPGWYRKDWYDLNTKKLANDNAKQANANIPFPNLPNCTTADMIEVSTNIIYVFQIEEIINFSCCGFFFVFCFFVFF